MSLKLNFGRDVQGYNTYAPDFATIKYAVTLSANVAQSITVPSTNENWIIAFSYQPGTSVWIAQNATATLPTGTVSLTNSEQIAGARKVYAGDTISFITSLTTADFGILLYAVN